MTKTMLLLAAAGCMLAMPTASIAAPAFAVNSGISAPAATEIGWRARRYVYRNNGYPGAYNRVIVPGARVYAPGAYHPLARRAVRRNVR